MSGARDKAGQLQAREFDRVALGRRGPALEQLDPLTVQRLLGVRSAAPAFRQVAAEAGA